MRLLTELGERMEFLGAQPIGLVICGGAAMNILKIVDRPTKDIDVLALAADDPRGITLAKAELPDDLLRCREAVARDNNLGSGWLNTGPRELFRLGLPKGIESRLRKFEFGSRLRVYLVSRIDMIFLKLFAAVGGSSREAQHIQDLEALRPKREELERAVEWVLQKEPNHDKREQMKEILRRLLSDMGYSDLAYGL